MYVAGERSGILRNNCSSLRRHKGAFGGISRLPKFSPNLRLPKLKVTCKRGLARSNLASLIMTFSFHFIRLGVISCFLSLLHLGDVTG